MPEYIAEVKLVVTRSIDVSAWDIDEAAEKACDEAEARCGGGDAEVVQIERVIEKDRFDED